MLRSRVGTIAVGVVVGAVVAGGISYAAIPHSRSRQITACILKSGTNKGATRIIDAQRGAVCKSTETEIEWSAAGVNWRGNWSSAASYQTNDVVYFSGTSWRALRPIPNTIPGTSGVDWVYLARSGSEGPEGPAGPAGPDGQDGTDGQDLTIQRPVHTITDVDIGTNQVGLYTRVAIGTDGLPVVAHRDLSAGTLRVSHCDDIACTTATSTTVDDPAVLVGYYVSMSIGTDGLPIIAHTDGSGSLRVTHCDDIACTTATTNAHAVGAGYTSIAIGIDGLPIIASRDSSAEAVRVTHCDDIACTTASSTTVDDPANSVGYWPSMTIGADGLPIISHGDDTADALRVSHCDDIACTTASSTTVDDPANNVGLYSSIAVGTDGLPVIAHRDSSVGGLRITRCDDIACTTASSTTVDDTANSLGHLPSITIGRDGRPIIAHQDASAGNLRITHCNDTACASGSSINVDSSGYDGFYATITIGADGYPIISHNLSGTNALRVTHCSNRYCLPYHRAR